MSSDLARAHIEAQARLRAQTALTVAAAWKSLPSYNEADVGPWLSLVIPVVAAAQRASVMLVDAFIAAVLGRPPLAIDPTPLIGAGVREGVAPSVVYRRPFVTVWTDLSDQVPWDRAVLDGLERALVAAETDVQLSMRSAAREVADQDDEIVGYRRVADPTACGLCLVASTQRYHTDDLMPIHSRCGCGIEPLTGAEDPGQIIDRDLHQHLKKDGVIDDLTFQRGSRKALERAAANRERANEFLAEALSETDPDRADRLRDRAAIWAQRARRQEQLASDWRERQRQRAATQRVRAAVRTHGELGPVLVNAAHRFTTAADLAA